MKKSEIRGYFASKKITVMGLGLLGRGIGDVKFLAKAGADLVVTDLKTKEQLAEALQTLKKDLGAELFGRIKFVLGRHEMADFKNRDFILSAAGVPLDSPYVAEARKNGIPVKMDASWFVELSPETTVIGITGTRGKSTTTHLIYEILKVAGKSIYLGGNVRGIATLPHLEKIKEGEIVIMELDSWQLQGFGEAKISPHISVFTNLMVDHQNYYKNNMNAYFADKANIFLNQKEGDYLVAGQDVLKRLQKKYKNIAKRTIVPDVGIIPKNWKVKLLGEHNLKNIAYAIAVAHLLDIPQTVIKKAVEDYKGMPGRLEFIKEVGGVKYYNDTTATTPEAVLSALQALRPILKGEASMVLISGGTDKELEYKDYAKEIPK